MCSRCKKRPAVVYVSRVEDGKTINDGYCIQCAKELNIGPINDMLKNMNISDEEIENMNNGITEMMKEFVNPETGEFDASAIEEQFGNMFGGMSPMSIVNGMTPSPDSEGLEEVLAEPVEDDDTDKKQKKNKKKRRKTTNTLAFIAKTLQEKLWKAKSTVLLAEILKLSV